MNIDFEVDRLNRLFKIYVDSTNSNRIRPYRISRLKKYLENLLISVKNQFEIITIDANNIGDYFYELKDKLKPFSDKKELAGRLGNFEQAGAIRDRENELIKADLIRSGIPPNIFFFHRDNKIFKV